MNLSTLFHLAIRYNVSDIHIDNSIYFRINKQIVLVAPCNTKIDSNIGAITQNDIENIKVELVNLLETFNKSFDNLNEQSLTIQVNQVKCRVSTFLSHRNLHFALRILRTKIPDLQTLGTPPILEHLSMQEAGLLLVCGSTGVGKSTTLAGMLNHINIHSRRHILTIEDPIEYEHESQQCLLTQREIGVDSQSYGDALKASLRHDPDVILIGEILDSEVLKLAINHALSGHLVLASFHAKSCSHAIARILGMTSGDLNAHANLADCLQGIITQRLYEQENVLRADFEILVANPAVRILIKENKINQIDSQISMGKEFGMQHFSKHHKP
ncbi:twitching motility protein [Helicobacter didelphidarum]|uniref:Twitching motility protein n=1 Tax=Helicobacter didelphidarum TaxID=2040648 RepID=A0A3D8IMV4_9HELI|nr:ATPase, T2SS/T4P/T4SS family [Helicobacter didelphidarum]RDU66236.1 twitching motility protein [Helicobacter didelphidarum]